MTDAFLHLEVRLKHGRFKVDAKLDAGPGVTALFGRSGSGKSTLVHILAGLINPDEGVIRVDGKTLFDSSQNINVAPQDRHVGCVFQDARLFPHLSVAKNLKYGLNRLPIDQQADTFAQVVDVLGLDHLLTRRPARLSGGEKQRVAIGRALLSNPNLLLMDEPLANLDSARKNEILPYIERLNTTFNLPVVYVSHNIDEVVRLADTLALVDDGCIAAVGPVQDIMARLDLSPLTGRFEAGAVLNLLVDGHDEAVGLTQLNLQGHPVFTPHIGLKTGQSVRLRIRARDVSLALTPPKNTSILNQLPVIVTDVKSGDGPHVELALSIQSKDGSSKDAPQTLLARITKKSFSDLNLDIGKPVHALIKTVSIDQKNLIAQRQSDLKPL